MVSEKSDMLWERDIVTHLIVSERFCREVVSGIQPRFFEVDYARLLIQWILPYYKEYKRAPGRDILKLYGANQNNIKDSDLKESVLDFITRLNKDWKTARITNEEFAVKKAREYLDKRRLQVLVDELQINIEAGDMARARNLLMSAQTITVEDSCEIDILNDTESIIDAFIGEEDIMFSFPGAFGKVAGLFHREDFVAFTAPMKAGKSWALMYTALTAMYAGYRVLFFTLEMSGAQMVRRFWQSIYGQVREEIKVRVPYFEQVENEGKEAYLIKCREVRQKVFDALAVKRRQKTQKQVARGGDVKIVALPAYAKSVVDLEEIVSNYAHGFTKDGKPYPADVIVVDYADILAPSSNQKGEYRHNLDETWKRLRGLAQSKKCLVVTASQAGREAFKRDVSAENISEDIRKLAHVTSMIGLNQTIAEGKAGLMRVSQLAIREGAKEYRQAIVLQALSLGKFHIDSRFRGDVLCDTLIDLKTGEDLSGEAVAVNGSSNRKRARRDTG